MSKQPHGAGKTSFDLPDAPMALELLKLKNGCHIVDIGCGRGNYSLAMAPLIAPDGKIIAVDLWEEGIELLAGEIESRKIENIEPKAADATQALPVEDDWADICLTATVFHDLAPGDGREKTMEEIKRVLRPDGIFAVLEFQKIDGPPGPPKGRRLGPEDLDGIIQPAGFSRKRLSLLGPCLYLAEYAVSGR